MADVPKSRATSARRRRGSREVPRARCPTRCRTTNACVPKSAARVAPQHRPRPPTGRRAPVSPSARSRVARRGRCRTQLFSQRDRAGVGRVAGQGAGLILLPTTTRPMLHPCQVVRKRARRQPEPAPHSHSRHAILERNRTLLQTAGGVRELNLHDLPTIVGSAPGCCECRCSGRHRDQPDHKTSRQT